MYNNNYLGTWTPQGQFIQQLPPHQLDDLRYPQYAVSGYPQPAPGLILFT